MSRLLVFIVLLYVGSSLRAETCDAEHVLERLHNEVLGELDQRERTRVREILQEFCGEVRVETRETVARERKAAETTEGFGIEIRKADPDSRGHERLKKR